MASSTASRGCQEDTAELRNPPGSRYPPFRFNACVGGATYKIVEADSDASFRKVNARTQEAQEAPRNRYAQTYLEGADAPRAGDLRISVITEGDPVIVGSVFVHQRS